MAIPSFNGARHRGVSEDRRAARIRAAADADVARADAATRGLLADEDVKDRAASRRRRERELRRLDWQRRWRSTAAATRAILVNGAPRVVFFVACAAPSIIAMRGQLAFARGPMQLGPLSPLWPAMLEGAAWVLAWERARATRDGQRTGLLGCGMWGFALVGAAMNFWHGAATTSAEVGAGYAAASLLGFALVELHVRREASPTRPRLGLVLRRLVLALARAARFPRLSFAACSRLVELGPGADPAEAWRQAWLDRFGVAPGAGRTQRERARRDVRATRRALRQHPPGPGPAEGGPPSDRSHQTFPASDSARRTPAHPAPADVDHDHDDARAHRSPEARPGDGIGDHPTNEANRHDRLPTGQAGDADSDRPYQPETGHESDGSTTHADRSNVASQQPAPPGAPQLAGGGVPTAAAVLDRARAEAERAEQVTAGETLSTSSRDEANDGSTAPAVPRPPSPRGYVHDSRELPVGSPEWQARYDAIPGKDMTEKAVNWLWHERYLGHTPTPKQVDAVVDGRRTGSVAVARLRARGVLPPPPARPHGRGTS
jgi:hypothetical protein